MSEASLSMAPQGRPATWRIWYRLARPFSLTASVLPVLVGGSVAFATGAFAHVDLFLAMLVASVLIQIATNMFNEYYDYKHGLDTPQTVGIAGAIVRGYVAPITVLAAAMGCLVLALGLGTYIVGRTTPEVFLVGVACAFAGYLYTGGPLPIAYTPLGELEVFVFMGPVMVGLTYFIQAGQLSAPAIWASLPVGCLVASILLANNLRDHVADRQVGRRTIPVVLGRKVGLAIYVALLVGASLTTAAAVVMGALPWPALLPLITARTPIRLVGLYLSHEEPRALDRAVRGSAGLHARFNLLLALGIALGPMVGWVHATL